MNRRNQPRDDDAERSASPSLWPEREGASFVKGVLWTLPLTAVLWFGLFKLFSLFA